MDIRLSYFIDITPFENLVSAIEGLKEQLEREVEAFGYGVLVQAWHKEAATALKRPGGYIQKIDEGIEYPFEHDPLQFFVVNRHVAAKYLEEGVQPFDLKKMLSTSAKVKVGKDGKRYIHIPFEHSTSELKEAGVYEGARGLRESRITTIIRNTARGDQRSYDWGGRLKGMGDLGRRSKVFPVTGDLARSGAGKPGSQTLYPRGGEPTGSVRYTWKTSPFENIVRFKAGPGSGSRYSSFRTISENSDPQAWIHPGIQASHIAEKAINSVKTEFYGMLAKAVKDAFQKAGLAAE